MLAALAGAALGCPAEMANGGPRAIACGRVVAHYLGLYVAVEVVDAVTEPNTGKVRIDYRSMDDMNTPLEGVALCRFDGSASGDGSSLALTSAFVDENQLVEGEIASFNASGQSARAGDRASAVNP